MHVLKNVLRKGIAAGASLALLASCQDRGQFQSRNWTADQLAQHKQALMDSQVAKQPKSSSTAAAVPQGSQLNPTPSTGSGTAAANPPPATATSGTNPANPSQPVPSTTAPGAQTQILTEALAQRDQFIDDNNKLLQAGVDATAVAAVPGITLTLSGDPTNLQIEIMAVVQIGQDLRFLHVDTTPIAYSQDGKLAPLTVTLKESDQSDAKPVDVGTSVIAYAACKDQGCSEIQVRLQIQENDAFANAAFRFQGVSGALPALVATNLADKPENLATFEKAQSLFPGSGTANAGQTPAPATPAPDKVPTDVVDPSGTASSSTTTPVPATPASTSTASATPAPTTAAPSTTSTSTSTDTTAAAPAATVTPGPTSIITAVNGKTADAVNTPAPATTAPTTPSTDSTSAPAVTAPAVSAPAASAPAATAAPAVVTPAAVTPAAAATPAAT